MSKFAANQEGKCGTKNLRPDARSLIVRVVVYGVTVQYTETGTARLSLLVNFCAPNANVAQYVMFVPCPFVKERCWLYTLC